MRYLFFSAGAESPAGYYLMNMWHPVEIRQSSLGRDTGTDTETEIPRFTS